MHTESINDWQHSHTFGQDKVKKAEKYTLIVIVITALTMVVEIVAGILFGSMALLADGVHMATHAVALAIAAFAYYYTRKNAGNERFSFGTGKVNTLAGFASALLLAVFAFFMVWESVKRLISPVEILFNQAIIVAVIGFVVNVVCMLILSRPKADAQADHHDHGHSHDHNHSHSHNDHNLQAAYLHVIADALTSVFAIVALLTGKYWGLIWMDPVMGIVGAAMVARWSWGLLRITCGILLDEQAPTDVRSEIRNSLENDDDRIADLHVWSIGPNLYAANISLVTSDPKPAENYKKKLPHGLDLVHVTLEIQECVQAN